MGFTRQGLTFREVEPDDLQMLRDQRNHEWSGYRDPLSVQTHECQQLWYESLGRDNQAFIVQDDSGFIVGLVRFSSFDMLNRSVGITGVDVFPGNEGHGFATKIMKASAEYLLHDLGFHRCWGECTPENKGMRRAMEKAGYILEATFREAIWRSGQWHDFLRFSMLQQELWKDEVQVPEGL